MLGKVLQAIADLAGISLPIDTRIIVGLETKVGKEVPFSLEKLSPIFAMYVATDINHAKELCLSLLELGGMGHSLSLHTETDEVAREFAIEMPVSRILVNTMSSVGAVGGTTGLMPSMTLGCGTFGGNITSDNVTAKHLLNIKRMAYGIKEVNLTSPKVFKNKINNSPDDVTDQVVESVLQSLGSSDKVNPKIVKDLVSEIVNKLSK